MSKVPADLKYTKSHEWVASDVYAPLAGEVTGGNGRLGGEPQVVNSDPYGEGWLMRLKPAAGALSGAALLTAAEYQRVLEAEGG
ncbi:MAG: hypothetical protein E6K38_13195 [Gammaproteobacteria bacterium]|nr:MAG: hypothetical protein E6K38_13195 [Gammaproteobacteria bacterium]